MSELKPQEQSYQWLWDNMVFGSPASPSRKAKDLITEEKIKDTATKILANKAQYEAVVVGTKIPWEFIGVTHYRESTLSFKKHLHEGSPLTGRTKNVPKGRPVKGNPPFTWLESAKDAIIALKKLDKVPVWDIETILRKLEEYNGLGYRKYHPEVLSPYLWSGTQYYVVGKYASDGKWDAKLVDAQIGCVPLYKYLTDETLGLVINS